MKEKGRVEFGIRICLFDTDYGFSFPPIKVPLRVNICCFIFFVYYKDTVNDRFTV